MIHSLASALCATLAFALPIQGAEPDVSDSQPAFPASTALEQGVSPDALGRLDALIRSFVDDDEIVGAELLVIKNGRTLWHEAYGLADRESGSALERGSVFCVRSMTKPLIGTATLILIDDKLLDLDDKVSTYLPSFDVDGKREITVEHLLTHTSGLSFSQIAAADLDAIEGLRGVVELGANSKLEFVPGAEFAYSDQGTDTLAEVVEVIAGMPVAEFVQTRILDSLGMSNSTTVMTEEHALRARALPKYVGARGSWTRFWSPDEQPLFPFFLGSQGLYSTTEDYARFMDMWMHKGRVGKTRLLRSLSVRKALAPSPHAFPGGTGFPNARGAYGYLMQLWLRAKVEADGAGDQEELIAFGHSGSDGTHAWAFPEERAIVMYFTQSRGNATGMLVEEVLGELFLGEPFDANQVAPPLDPYLGYYFEGEGDLYRAIVRDGDDLALEIMGQGVVPLTYVGEDRWKLRPSPKDVIAFDRNEAGEITGYHIGDHQEFRLEPYAGPVELEDLQARVQAAYRFDLLETVGPMRTVGRVSIENLGMEGSVETIMAWPGRFRATGERGGEFESVAIDGADVWYETSKSEREKLEGERAALLRLDNPFAHYGDWSLSHDKLEVVQRLGRDGRTVYLVRTGDASAPASTMYVDYETGRVMMLDGLTYITGMGRTGYRIKYDDFRDQSGVLLPFRSEMTLPNQMIGTFITTIDRVEIGVELPEGTFQLANE